MNLKKEKINIAISLNLLKNDSNEDYNYIKNLIVFIKNKKRAFN
ncbi:hypothetical protein [Paraclostridium sordellii]|nr:hypothetical protein [Paeniclostridium sordellii]